MEHLKSALSLWPLRAWIRALFPSSPSPSGPSSPWRFWLWPPRSSCPSSLQHHSLQPRIRCQRFDPTPSARRRFSPEPQLLVSTAAPIIWPKDCLSYRCSKARGSLLSSRLSNSIQRGWNMIGIVDRPVLRMARPFPPTHWNCHNEHSEARVHLVLPASQWVFCIPGKAMCPSSQPILSLVELRRSSTGETCAAAGHRRVGVPAACRKPGIRRAGRNRRRGAYGA